MLSFKTHYGQITDRAHGFSGPLPKSFTFNTPVGNAIDKNGHLWVCDTGNNRVVILNDSLTHILDIVAYTDQTPLLLPFHLADHPEKHQMYLTDMGNRRVVVLDYGDQLPEGYTRFAFAFGDQPDECTCFTPLSDPNGLAFVKEDEKFLLFVTDEFFYTKDDLRNRCVKFSDTGIFLDDFRQLKKGETINELKWPQGLAADAQGNLYIANTGDYEVLKCQPNYQIVGNTCQINDDAETGDVFVHSFGNPTGSDFGNIIRGVDVIGEHIFVADQVDNKVSVYDAQTGKLLCLFGDMVPLFPAKAQTISDWWYYTLSNRAMLGPYSICPAKNKGEYFITEPVVSRLIKIKVPALENELPQPSNGQVSTLPVLLLQALGERRNHRDGADSQFNMVTSVVRGTPTPAHVRQQQPWWAAWSGEVYKTLFDSYLAPFWKQQITKGQETFYNIDAGNWTIKGYREAANDFTQTPRVLQGLYTGGTLALATYTPSVPLLGQIVPGSPIILASNFIFAKITMYQFNLDGKLINYGLPFGNDLEGPQGLSVSPKGEVYIADFVGNKVEKWQILPSGYAQFVKSFRPPDQEAFMPMDTTVDREGRVLVCDQVSNQILAFSPDGDLLWRYGKTGYCKDLSTEYDQFQLPTSVFVDENNHLIVNDLVNRALKVFEIGRDTLHYKTGKLLFMDLPEAGGSWMPFFLYAEGQHIYLPDSAYNIVSVYTYEV
ncbi:MAG: NHL repeat-containing protein [Bernardetiaceae bacterium]